MAALMVQGVSSWAGKSLVATALVRFFARRGIRVAPFKGQNMSNNARVVAGGEIGVAQYLQALAAGVEPDVRMNPVLVKPEGDTRSQVVVDLERGPHGPIITHHAVESKRRLERAARSSGRDGHNTDLANMRPLAQMLAPRCPHAHPDRAGHTLRSSPDLERLGPAAAGEKCHLDEKHPSLRLSRRSNHFGRWFVMPVQVAGVAELAVSPVAALSAVPANPSAGRALRFRHVMAPFSIPLKDQRG